MTTKYSYPLTELFVDALCRAGKLEGALEAFIHQYETEKERARGIQTEAEVRIQTAKTERELAPRPGVRLASAYSVQSRSANYRPDDRLDTDDGQFGPGFQRRRGLGHHAYSGPVDGSARPRQRSGATEQPPFPGGDSEGTE